jgi:N-acetylmuramoyl-L-alanine amidase
MAFQRDNGLSVDGIVGPQTIGRLFAAQQPQNPQPQPQPQPEPQPQPQPPASGFTQFHGTPGALAGKVIFIDAGHGGTDPGATREHPGYGLVKEKDLAFDMALRLKRILEEAGATVVLVRPDDKYYSLFYRSALVNTYILQTELSAVEKDRDAAAQTMLAKEGALTQKRQQKAQKEADVAIYQTELQFAIEKLLQYEGQLAELQIKLNQAIEELEDRQKASQEQEENELDAGELEAAVEEAQAIVNQLNADMEEVAQKINALKAEIADLQKAQEDAQHAIAQLEDDIFALQAEIEDMDNHIRDKNQQIDNLMTRIGQFRRYLDNPNMVNREGIYSVISINGRNYANADLVEVFDLTGRKYQDDYLFISLHCNSTGAHEQTSSSGISVFYRDNGPYSYNGTYGVNVEYYKGYNAAERERFANILLEQINAATNFSKKYTAPYKADFSVLRENNVISVLIEVGFINNPNDRALLLQQQVREDVAAGIYKGIVEYYKK